MTDSKSVIFNKIFNFLEEIGIEYFITDDDFPSFLRGITIDKGKLKINPEYLLCTGDILHEAGHLACIPAHLRSKADDNIEISIGSEYTLEMGVILWSVAAALHLNIPLTEIFPKKGYKGSSETLIEQYTSKNYIGLPLLQWMGLAAHDDEVIENEALAFPNMLRWLRK